MTTTEYEAVPAVARDEAAPRSDTVVMKFGGTSVADAEKLKHVARRLVAARENGARVVAVLSAMGSTTDELLELARRSPPGPSRASSTCSSPSASGSRARSPRWRFRTSATRRSPSLALRPESSRNGPRKGEDRGRPREAN